MITSSTKSVGAGSFRGAGQLGIDLLLHLDLARHDHEEEHDDENHVDHRRDLEADLLVVMALPLLLRVSSDSVVIQGGDGDIADARRGRGSS